jgi:F-type H+-transporting ATPase subunit delta
VDKLTAVRYAGALMDIALESGRMAETLDGASEFIRAIDGSEELSSMLVSADAGAEDKIAALEKIFGGRVCEDEFALNSEFALNPANSDPANSDPANSYIIGLAAVMIRKGRAGGITDALRTFVDMAEERLGRTRARVVSAVPLSEESAAGILRSLQAKLGKEVSLSREVDPSLIGGFRVEAGGRVFDATIKRELDDMRKHLQSMPITGEAERSETVV